MNGQERIEYFKEQIARLSNQVVDLQNERDALLKELHKANSIIIDLQRIPPKFSEEYIAEIRAEAVSEFLHILEHAPSSPVSAMTALGVSQWWDKFKAAKVRQGGE